MPPGLDLRLDPWEGGHGAELPLEIEASDAATADLGVERPRDRWEPLAPASSAPPTRLVFIDGVRRVEARVVGRSGERVVHGVLGSYGVGSVVVEACRARWDESRVDRVLALGSGEAFPEAVVPGPGLAYRPVSTADTDPDAPVRRLQEEMRSAEAALARELAAAGTLVLADGPLRFGDARGAAVGYVKRLFLRHGIPLDVLARLEPGQRTPLVHLSGSGFGRYSWCQRLAAREPADFDLAGLVRLEVSDSVGLEAARALADGAAGWLPGFAPTRARDPRAPQNLLPIGALEARLRRLLGDASLIRRKLATAFASLPEVARA